MRFVDSPNQLNLSLNSIATTKINISITLMRETDKQIYKTRNSFTQLIVYMTNKYIRSKMADYILRNYRVKRVQEINEML